MKYTLVCIDVRCDKTSRASPVYRLYLDNILIIERKFWVETPLYFIQDQLTVYNDNEYHTVRLENVRPELGNVFISKVKSFDADTQEKNFNTHDWSEGKNSFKFLANKR